MSHPLDRPVWHALATCQATLAEGDERARRFDPDYAAFGAARDDGAESQAALAALMPAGGELWLVEAGALSAPPGTRIVRSASIVQMVLTGAPPAAEASVDTPLDEEDAPAMQRLAALTRPGPFFRSTHRLGSFYGVHHDGELAAMAGERLRLPGFTEVSGVCTHPAHRGQGLAAALMACVIAGIRARGDVPFLTAYADNAGAIRLYETLGFTCRASLTLAVLAKDI